MSIKVALFYDNPGILKPYENFLKGRGFEVNGFGSFEDTLKLADSRLNSEVAVIHLGFHVVEKIKGL